MSMTKHLMREKFRGNKRTPLVMMLEPLHACNLTCEGCGRIVEYKDTITDQMSLEECIDAARECNTPVISICGGEPLIYRHIDALVDKYVEMGRYIYLCTNAMFLDRFLPKHKPTDQLFITVHLDGMRDTHDRIVERKGVWDMAVEHMKQAKAMGYKVLTNTTVFKTTDPKELDELFTFLTYLGLDGLLVSPAFSFESLGDDPYGFNSKEEVHEKFEPLLPMLHKYRMFSTPQYLEFLAGKREYPCSPWGNIVRNPQGWKGPCYAITDSHYKSYRELLESTDWDYYARQEDPRCHDCKMHSGFEASVVFNMTLSDAIRSMKWQFAA